MTPEPERRGFRTRGGLELIADDFGDAAASPVVLLHGGGQTRHAWGGTATELARRGWYALCLDLRGHGESAWSPDGNYGFEVFVEDLRDVACALSAPPAVVGASLGGITALLAAGGADPIAVRALVLVDIAPRVEPDGAKRIVDFMTANPDGFASLEQAAEAVASYVPHRRPPKDLSGLRKNLRLGADGRWRWHWDPLFMQGRGSVTEHRRPGLHEAALDEAARALRLPVLLVRGKLSDLLSEAGARHFLSLVPHAEFVDVAEAGHMVAGDRNDLFTRAVADFLARTAPPAL